MKGNPIGKIILYIFLKYTLLYLLLMVIWDNGALIKYGTINDLKGWFSYLCIYYLVPTFSLILLSWLLYFSLTMNSLSALIVLFSIYILADYLMFVYLVGNSFIHIHGFYSILIGTTLFLAMFHKRISKLYKGKNIQ